jgi:hypothetical protein
MYSVPVSPRVGSSASITDVRRGATPPAAYSRPDRISCDPCRKRKIKCDRVWPCNSCVKRNIQDMCYQEDRGRESSATVARRNQRSKPSLGSVAGAAYRIDKQESDVDLHPRGVRRLTSAVTVSPISSRPKIEMIDILDPVIQAGANLYCERLIEVGSGEDGRIMWRDISSHVPSPDECEELIMFYFEEVSDRKQNGGGAENKTLTTPSLYPPFAPSAQSLRPYPSTIAV